MAEFSVGHRYPKSFEVSFGNHYRVINWDVSNYYKAVECAIRSGIKAIFNCACHHKFKVRVSDVLLDDRKLHWCPYCTGRQICGKEDCEECFIKSFASHVRSVCWSNKNPMPAIECTLHSSKKVWFDCDVCEHEFEAAASKVSDENNPRWCPYCSHHRLCELENCEDCFNKSFASHHRSDNYSTKNPLPARMYFINSNKKAWFDCGVCPHDFEATIANVTRIKKGTWCPYCCDNQILCSSENCNFCFNNSFASNHLVMYWDHEKNILTPRQCTKSCKIKIWFICNNKHSFEVLLNSVNRGDWCPLCKNKTAIKVFKFLEKHFSEFIIEREVRFDWCKNERCLPFDFLIGTTLIELDGIQHFEFVKYFKKSVEYTVHRDQYKLLHVLKNGYTMIRIFQPDVYADKNNWKYKLACAIECHKRDMNCYTLIASDMSIYNKHRITELES